MRKHEVRVFDMACDILMRDREDELLQVGAKQMLDFGNYHDDIVAKVAKRARTFAPDSEDEDVITEIRSGLKQKIEDDEHVIAEIRFELKRENEDDEDVIAEIRSGLKREMKEDEVVIAEIRSG